MKLAFVAIVSFTLGVAATLFINPTRRVFAQDAALNNGWMPIVPPLGSASPAPVVPPFPHITLRHNTIVSAHGAPPLEITLDGFEQTGNVWGGTNGVRFIYGGGAYKLTGNAIVGPISLVLTGAAANTAGLLEQFGFLAKNDPPTITPSTDPPKAKNRPNIHKATIPTPFKGEMSSQYDGTEK